MPVPRQTCPPSYENKQVLLGRRRPWYIVQEVIRRTNDCEKYFRTFPVLAADKEFVEFEKSTILEPSSLAFSHLIHKDISILEVFLALYFRPNNFHCVHIDRKASRQQRKAVNGLIRCYSLIVKRGAIFAIPENESSSVEWGGKTMLEADMKCLEKLVRYKNNRTISWLYSSSVAGSELPIVTYSNFHNTLTLQLGQNHSSVESFPIPRANLFRLTHEQMTFIKPGSNKNNTPTFEIPNSIITLENNIPSQNSTLGNQFHSVSIKKPNITFKVFKGVRNVILSSKDVNFFVNHPVAKAMYDWFQLGDFTEEHFYATLIRLSIDANTNVVTQNMSGKVLRMNSGRLTFTDGNTLHGICPRFTSWGCHHCFGQCLNTICNFHILDLDKISEDSTECLIANKFNLDVDPFTVTLHWINILRKVSIETTDWDEGNLAAYISRITKRLL